MMSRIIIIINCILLIMRKEMNDEHDKTVDNGGKITVVESFVRVRLSLEHIGERRIDR